VNLCRLTSWALSGVITTTGRGNRDVEKAFTVGVAEPAKGARVTTTPCCSMTLTMRGILPSPKFHSARSIMVFTRRVAHFVTVERTVRTVDGHETATYVVDGELFFASSNDLYTQFEYALDPEYVVIDLHASHLWDARPRSRPWTPSREVPPPRHRREDHRP
jgi:MFS superfamily sulfate permease-like transporter